MALYPCGLRLRDVSGCVLPRRPQVTSGSMKRFDPFEILELSMEASTADIKRAYRQMSLKYHPDKVLSLIHI